MGQKTKKNIDNDTQADGDMMAVLSGIFGAPETTDDGETAEGLDFDHQAVIGDVNSYMDTHTGHAVILRAHDVEKSLSEYEVPPTWTTVRAFRALADALEYSLKANDVEDVTKDGDTADAFGGVTDDDDSIGMDEDVPF